MNTSEYVLAVLGCTKAECKFVDNLCDKFPSFGDWDDFVLENFLDFSYERGTRLCNYLISTLFLEVIEEGVKLGLERGLFNIELNSVCSKLYYNGNEINSEEEFDNLLVKRTN